MMDPTQLEEFVKRLTENQTRIHGYVYSLLGNHNQASDVVQETNLVLWRKNDEYDCERPFLPWAFSIARFQVLAYIRDQKRDRCLLDEDLVRSMATVAEKEALGHESIETALQDCIRKLTKQNQELLRMRYFREKTISELAVSMNRGQSAVKTSLMRIRKTLMSCIQSRIEETS
ncbi:MAG: sigma-70 family RNA polymerase sigma factor [Planctomycetota bacterium]